MDFVDNWSISNAKLVGLKTTSQGYVPDFRPYVSDVPSLSRTYVLKRKGLPDIDLRSYYEYFKLSDRNDVHTLIKILKEIEKTENAPKISDAMQRIKKLLP